jgi:signal transduction histidine kinase
MTDDITYLLEDICRHTASLLEELDGPLAESQRADLVPIRQESNILARRLAAALILPPREWRGALHDLRSPLNAIVGFSQILSQFSPPGTLNEAQLASARAIYTDAMLLATRITDVFGREYA